MLKECFAGHDTAVIVQSADMAAIETVGTLAHRVPFGLVGLDVGIALGVGFCSEVPILTIGHEASNDLYLYDMDHFIMNLKAWLPETLKTRL